MYDGLILLIIVHTLWWVLLIILSIAAVLLPWSGVREKIITWLLKGQKSAAYIEYFATSFSMMSVAGLVGIVLLVLSKPSISTHWDSFIFSLLLFFDFLALGLAYAEAAKRK